MTRATYLRSAIFQIFKMIKILNRDFIKKLVLT